MRGRKPTPTVLFERHGKPSKGRAATPNHAEPKPVTGPLEAAPDWMSASQVLGWDYAMQHAPPGLLARIDRGMLTVWVVAEDLHRKATVAQNAAGSLMMKSPDSGYPMPSPYLAVINKQGLVMAKIASELGFSPASRPRVQADGAMAAAPRSANAQDAAPRPSLGAFLASNPNRHTSSTGRATRTTH